MKNLKIINYWIGDIFCIVCFESHLGLPLLSSRGISGPINPLEMKILPKFKAALNLKRFRFSRDCCKVFSFFLKGK